MAAVVDPSYTRNFRGDPARPGQGGCAPNRGRNARIRFSGSRRSARQSRPTWRLEERIPVGRFQKSKLTYRKVMQWFEAISRHSENEIDLADLGLAAFVLVKVVKARPMLPSFGCPDIVSD